mmetsp:Transcript_23972/g.58456  ORF Transcript_23972/g.58456 Transcript_23972/m.58456 type:complete len:236 (-) Transcript_23972:878-1585(-)
MTSKVAAYLTLNRRAWVHMAVAASRAAAATTSSAEYCCCVANCARRTATNSRVAGSSSEISVVLAWPLATLARRSRYLSNSASCRRPVTAMCSLVSMTYVKRPGAHPRSAKMNALSSSTRNWAQPSANSVQRYLWWAPSGGAHSSKSRSATPTVGRSGSDMSVSLRAVLSSESYRTECLAAAARSASCAGTTSSPTALCSARAAVSSSRTRSRTAMTCSLSLLASSAATIDLHSL